MSSDLAVLKWCAVAPGDLLSPSADQEILVFAPKLYALHPARISRFIAFGHPTTLSSALKSGKSFFICCLNCLGYYKIFWVGIDQLCRFNKS